LFQFSLCFKSQKTPQKCGVFLVLLETIRLKNKSRTKYAFATVIMISFT
jgi:hypothetical protein